MTQNGVFCDIYQIIRDAKVHVTDFEEADEGKQSFPKFITFPIINRDIWSELGDKLVEKEHLIEPKFSSSKYISLRLDLRSFSRTSKLLFGKVYSDIFESCMIKEMNAIYGFTQSDEMTVIIPPKYNDTMLVYNEHQFGGKRDKIISLTASFASITLYSACVLRLRKH
jgi:hypothetical protein